MSSVFRLDFDPGIPLANRFMQYVWDCADNETEEETESEISRTYIYPSIDAHSIYALPG